MPRGVELPPELAAAVAAQAKAAMAEHTADLEDRLRLADAQRAEAEKKVYELESTLVRRDVELSAARQQHASDLRDREPGGDARAAALGGLCARGASWCLRGEVTLRGSMTGPEERSAST